MKNAIIIPALEPSESLIFYIERLIENGIKTIVVVNDGSSENKKYIFEEIGLKKGLTVLSHTQNMGKGAAIKTAVFHIRDYMPEVEGIITVDADGQHSVEDVLRINDALIDNRYSLVLGVREFDKNTPTRSMLGNKISSTTLKLLYGIKLDDTQTGLRAISRKYFDWLLSIDGERYEYETNMLIKSKKIALAIHTITIKTLYFDNNSQSHFRAIRDGAKVYSQMLSGMFQYVANSLVSVATDITIFVVLFYLTGSILTATIAMAISATISRIISSLVNFRLNRNTFTSKENTSYRAYLKYYSLWLGQLSLSILLVAIFSSLFGLAHTIVKLFVDIFLAMISYQIQIRWVFKADFKRKIKKATKDELLQVQEFNELIKDIIKIPQVENMKNMSQHKNNVTLFDHLLYTAYISYRISAKFGLDKKETVRGAILHDFRLEENPKLVKLFSHSKTAVKEATLFFDLTEREKNIIESHMWPLNITLIPKSKEALVVSLADTYCATMELFGIVKRPKTSKTIERLSVCGV